MDLLTYLILFDSIVLTTVILARLVWTAG